MTSVPRNQPEWASGVMPCTKQPGMTRLETSNPLRIPVNPVVRLAGRVGGTSAVLSCDRARISNPDGGWSGCALSGYVHESMSDGARFAGIERFGCELSPSTSVSRRS